MANRRKTGKKQNVIYILFSLVLGMLLSWLSGDLTQLPIVYGILNNLGIWVVVISLLAYFSSTAFVGGLASLAFIGGSIIATVLRTVIDGGWVVTTVVSHLLLCIMAGLLGFIVWYSREKQWLGALCGSIPVSVLIGEGYPIIYSKSAVLGFDIVAAVFLYIFLLKGRDRKLMALPFILIMVALIIYFDPITRILGGHI